MSPYFSMKPCHLIPLSDLEMNSMDCECYYANSKLSFSNQFACTRENELILSWLTESVTFLLPLVSEQESWKIFTFLIAGWSPHSFFGPKQLFPPFCIVINSWNIPIYLFYLYLNPEKWTLFLQSLCIDHYREFLSLGSAVLSVTLMIQLDKSGQFFV